VARRRRQQRFLAVAVDVARRPRTLGAGYDGAEHHRWLTAVAPQPKGQTGGGDDLVVTGVRLQLRVDATATPSGTRGRPVRWPQAKREEWSGRFVDQVDLHTYMYGIFFLQTEQIMVKIILGGINLIDALIDHLTNKVNRVAKKNPKQKGKLIELQK
jgi:hypothetical protein